MILYPKAKINIGLQITEKRQDGFHNLETFFYPADMTDIWEIVESNTLSITQTGLEYDGKPEDNLCVKAYNLIKERFNIPPVAIHLHKQIPVGAGLGGGSSDAANTLIIINKMFNLNIELDELTRISAKLGSDCPFFVLLSDLKQGEGAYATGRGEILERKAIKELDNYVVKVVKPPVFVSTAQAYSGVTPKRPNVLLRDLLELPVEQWRDRIENDFEKTIFKQFPIIEEYKRNMYENGAVYASMSGSGSSVFGLFKKG